MTPEEARKTIDDCMAFIDHHHTILRCIEREREEKKARVELLQNELPGLLAKLVLGELNGNESRVTQVEEEIESLQRELARIPATINGLQARQDSNNAAHARALNALHRYEAEEQFEEMKIELEQSFSKSLVGQFRQLAYDLGRSDEVRDWIDGLEENWRKRPLKDH